MGYSSGERINVRNSCLLGSEWKTSWVSRQRNSLWVLGGGFVSMHVVPRYQQINAQHPFHYPAKRGLVQGSWGNVPSKCSVQFRGSYAHANHDMSPHFSTNAAIHYDLARYACRLHMLDRARCWITAALGLANDRRVTEAARCDADLVPLWDYMSTASP